MNKRRNVLAATTAAALALPLAACGSSDSGSSDTAVAANPTFPAGTTMAKLAKAGKITIGTKFDVPLFGLKGLDGTPKGFDVEIAKIIAGKLGIDPSGIQWVETPSKVRDEYLAQDKVNMIAATYTITDERKTRVTFAGPYYNAGSTLMIKTSNKKIAGPESLKDSSLKVCTAIGAVDAEAVKKYLANPSSQLVQFDVFSKCADALRTGQVDAVAADSAVLLGLVSTSKGTFKTVGDTFFDQPYGVGLKKGDVKFCEFINGVLEGAVKDGTYGKAWKDTAGTADPKAPTLPKLGTCQ
ncbi:glutamate ABC transporter substrate-binding protein [Streptomyces chartreusis]